MSLDYAVNGAIRSKEVRLVGEDGEQIGVVKTSDAMWRAKQAGLDLVAIQSQSNPPVCKILDYGKFRFEQQKREKEAAKARRAAIIDTKEIQLRPVTDSNDLATKAKKAASFLAAGDRVKIIMKFKGREIHHSEMGRKVLESFLSSIGEHKLERPITLSERQLFTIAGPVPTKKP